MEPNRDASAEQLDDPSTAPLDSPPNPDDFIQGEATTLTDVITAFEARGFGGQFDERNGSVRCLTCRSIVSPSSTIVHSARRLEGASDPADSLEIFAVACPVCAAAGTLILQFGAAADLGSQQVLNALPVASRRGM
ncbi:MAG: hypothetical protein JJE46_04490 [Acidimicrobiia bacterium]|nr:hypothetical protein [Acidimicrobiia bacterium]